MNTENFETNKQEKELINTLRNTVVHGHIHLIKIFRDSNECMTYIQKTHTSVLTTAKSLCAAHMKTLDKLNLHSKMTQFAKISAQITAYEDILNKKILKSENPINSLHNLFEQLNAAEEELSSELANYEHTL